MTGNTNSPWQGQQQKFEALFNFATIGIVMANHTGGIILVNPQAEQQFGYERNELLNQKVEVLIPDQQRGKHVHHREQYNKKPVNRSMGTNLELYGRKKDGSVIPVEVSLSNFSEGGEHFVIAFIIDITERKNQQDKIKQLNVDLERKVDERTRILQEALMELEKSKDELSEALEKEKELNDMKSRFVSMASHEFRTPLSTVLSSVSLISRYTNADDAEKREKHVKRIKSAVNNLTLILNDFLSIGKLEEGKVSATYANFKISEVLEEVTLELDNALKAGQHIHVQQSGQDEVCLDRHFIQNILINLISNAIKFSPENKEIQVEVKAGKKQVMLAVHDSGIGISAEDQKQLFERFFRSNSVTAIQGTGLGLFIVAKYIDLMQGKIEVESELTKGTTFKVTLPLKKSK